MVLKSSYEINFELLRKCKEKGFCLCELQKNKSNICPCEEFLSNGICKCGVFNSVNTKTFIKLCV